MLRSVRAFLALSLVVGLVPLLIGQVPATPKRYALVVGINEYQAKQLGPLNYADRDANGLGDVLEQVGYSVVRLSGSSKGVRLQPTRENIDRELNALLRGVKKGDVVVLAFAGHGIQFVGEEDSFFCPSDARPDAKEKATLLSMQDLYGRMERSFATCVVLVDACRNDPGVRAAGKARNGVNASAAVPKGVAALFSCEAGEFAYESEKHRHGVFFYHTLERLRRAASEGEEITFNALADHVQDRVPDDVRTHHQAVQTPVMKVNAGRVVLLPRATIEAKPLMAPFGPKEIATARAAWARKLGVPEKKTLVLGGGVTMDLVLIPPGVFLMGSPETEKGREPYEKNERQHEVELTQAFYMAVTETTQAQYRVITGENPSRLRGDTLPVEKMSWIEAVSFCDKLGRKVGAKVSLPTEAQWEYACRAGTTTVFHFGDVLNGDRANCDGEVPYGTEIKGKFLGKSTPAGDPRYPANAFGLRDMHGNVREWCLGGYHPDYENLPRKDPLAEQHKEGPCIRRGGSWDIPSKDSRAAFRDHGDPDGHDFNDGFRVIVVP